MPRSLVGDLHYIRELRFSGPFSQNLSRLAEETHLSFAGTCPAIALSHSTLLMALSKIEGPVEWATADLPANERFEFLRALCVSVVNQGSDFNEARIWVQQSVMRSRIRSH
jgi:hypothetical protein